MKRLVSQVAPTDLLYCHMGDHYLPAAEFPIRRRGNWEAGASTSYRSYCKECHRSRNGGPSGPRLKQAGHKYVAPVRDHDEEVEAALGVLRDYRAQRQGVQGYVYLIIEHGNMRVGKIGYSTNPAKRVAELQTGNYRPLVLWAAKPGTETDEAALHQKYISDNVLAEWFNITPSLLREWPMSHGSRVCLKAKPTSPPQLEGAR